MSDPRPGRRPDGFTPAGLRSEEPGMRRPPRPVAVELATALVIISAAMSLLQSVEVYARLAQDGSEAANLVFLSLGIGVASLVVGLLLRTGRAWLVGVNVLAVAGFLELLSGTPMGIVSGMLDVLAVVILLVNRPWFAWRLGDRPETPAA